MHGSCAGCSSWRLICTKPTRYFYAERYTADPAGVPAVKAAAVAHMHRSLDIIESALDPWLCGSDLTIADVYLAMLGKWDPNPRPSAALARLYRAVAADPDYGSVWAKHGHGA